MFPVYGLAEPTLAVTFSDLGAPARVASCDRLAPSPVEHSRQHRHVQIGIVVDAHLALAVVQTMRSAGVLRDRSSPRDRKRQKQRVQTRIVEPLANVLTSREDERVVLPGSRETQRCEVIRNAPSGNATCVEVGWNPPRNTVVYGVTSRGIGGTLIAESIAHFASATSRRQ
jgi:hypothetical protein